MTDFRLRKKAIYRRASLGPNRCFIVYMIYVLFLNVSHKFGYFQFVYMIYVLFLIVSHKFGYFELSLLK